MHRPVVVGGDTSSAERASLVSKILFLFFKFLK